LLDDPDSPNRTFVHWILYNIDPKTTGIQENSISQSVKLGITSLEKPGFIGSCPNVGTHHYHFKLYALDTVLSLTDPDKATLENDMQGHILEKAEIIVLYGRD